MHFVENVEYTDKFNIPIFHKNFKENVRSKERKRASTSNKDFFFFWSIVVLQFCIGFCYTTT